MAKCDICGSEMKEITGYFYGSKRTGLICSSGEEKEHQRYEELEELYERTGMKIYAEEMKKIKRFMQKR